LTVFRITRKPCNYRQHRLIKNLLAAAQKDVKGEACEESMS
jgi:hypothetical protein